MLDSESKYASIVSDSITESTLQLTRSSMSFHTSPDTAFNPAGRADEGKAVADGLNHTSSSFSGPSKTLVDSRPSAASLLIVKCGVMPNDEGEPV